MFSIVVHMYPCLFVSLFKLFLCITVKHGFFLQLVMMSCFDSLLVAVSKIVTELVGFYQFTSTSL